MQTIRARIPNNEKRRLVGFFMIGAPLLVKGRQFAVGVEDSKTFPTNEPENQCIRFSIENSFVTVDDKRSTYADPENPLYSSPSSLMDTP